MSVRKYCASGDTVNCEMTDIDTGVRTLTKIEIPYLGELALGTEELIRLQLCGFTDVQLMAPAYVQIGICL